ncbi:MAG TPA: hypothetical protein PLW35_04670 [Verrucomicrobiota bacterium]|nr:hypothetical protein [Verrucomicrobiota bacterium]
MSVGRREAFGVRRLAAALFFCTNSVPVPIMAPFDRAADPNGFSRAAAGAVSVGRREALGVRQLAAALFFCTNNVSVPISHIPHQSDDRSYDPFRSRKSGHRTYTGWVRRRIAALLPAR